MNDTDEHDEPPSPATLKRQVDGGGWYSVAELEHADRVMDERRDNRISARNGRACDCEDAPCCGCYDE